MASMMMMGPWAGVLLAQQDSPGVRVITGDRKTGGAGNSNAAETGVAKGSAKPNPMAGKIMARDGALLSLLDEYVEFLMRESPEWASRRGDERYNDLLRDESPAGYTRRLESTKGYLERLKKLNRAAFNDEDALDADLLEYELTMGVRGAELYLEQMPINAMDGPHVMLPQLADMVPMRTAKHYADYAKRLERMSTYLDQLTEQMRAGMKAGRVPAKVTLRHAVTGLLAQGDERFVTDPTLSPFYRPFMKPGVDTLAGPEVLQQAREAIAKQVVSGFAKLATFVRDEYLPACRENVGYASGVDGMSAYEHQLKHYTTTAMTAEEIHAAGLTEVARIRAEMVAAIKRTDFNWKNAKNDDALFAEFLAFARTDDRFYFDSAEAMLTGYRDICKRLDAELPGLFKTLPRNTYGVRAIPAFAAKTSPAAYCYPGSIRSGIPGYFMVNTHDLRRRPKYGMVSLTIHEAVPGHHFQLAIADELEGVHTFRTLVYYTSYIEGWALYCEKLGLEMDPGEGLRRLNKSEHEAAYDTTKGFYADPYDDFGRLSDEIWRAARLVVDTGLHAKGWSRDQAINYMVSNTAGTEADLTTEVDRYISWPGQACAYKLGEMVISRLRRDAQAQLKDRFDIRAFHDVLLLGGSLPLPVLEKKVARWVELRAGQGGLGGGK